MRSQVFLLQAKKKLTAEVTDKTNEDNTMDINTSAASSNGDEHVDSIDMMAVGN